MKDRFVPVAPEAVAESAVKLVGSDWMLITAGTPEKYNMMTASWGNLGVLWNKPVATIYIRPQRYTYEFVEQSDFFTLCFFGEEHRNLLDICGTESGRAINKMNMAGLTPVATPAGSVCYAQARLVMECRKIYWQDLQPANFLVPDIAENYPHRDYHRMYIGEITECFRAR
jgi:flavin reductase (DIM6/NTAB) family NADH-FMN oxidoreductase RutF